MKILVLNQDWFVPELRAAGHEVVTAGFGPDTHLDLKINVPLFHIDRIGEMLPAGFEPDRIVALDNSSPILFSGLDEINIPTLFYSVDAHHHADLHKYLAQVFDYTLVAQKDNIPEIESLGTKVEWMPLWASRYVEASDEKERGAVFVGNLNPKLHPERARFFEELSKKVDVEFKMGEYWKFFPHSEIVINQTVKGDLNFRVFEAMMCGSMLLTERSGNGLFELFKDGEHLITYTKGDVDEAAFLIKRYLDDLPSCHRIAKAGRDEILARHTPAHRAARILSVLENLEKKRSALKFSSMALNFSAATRLIRKAGTGAELTTIAAALKSASYALDAKEILTQESACHIMMCAIEYDRLSGSKSGELLLARASELNPDELVLKLARIRALLNAGQGEDAQRIAESINPEDPSDVFRQAEKFISSMLTDWGSSGTLFG